MKQKIVIKVHMTCDKCRKKALALVASAHGVISAAITGDAKDRLEVVGDGVDSVRLVNCLRKKIGHAEIVKVEEVKVDKKKEEKKEDKKDEKKPCCPGYPYYCYCYCTPIRPPPIVVCEDDPICSIM